MVSLISVLRRFLSGTSHDLYAKMRAQWSSKMDFINTEFISKGTKHWRSYWLEVVIKVVLYSHYVFENISGMCSVVFVCLVKFSKFVQRCTENFCMRITDIYCLNVVIVWGSSIVIHCHILYVLALSYSRYIQGMLDVLLAFRKLFHQKSVMHTPVTASSSKLDIERVAFVSCNVVDSVLCPSATLLWRHNPPESYEQSGRSPKVVALFLLQTLVAI